MSEETFNEPRIALNRIYTRVGDNGQTSLVGGQRVAKNDARIEAYGTVDELNACVGLARATAEELGRKLPDLIKLASKLRRVQHELFNLGSILATLPADVHEHQPRITQGEVDLLEEEMDRANEELPKLPSFVLPGGSHLDAELHLCRTVCRRAERELVALSDAEPLPELTLQYLNRLSDALFVWSRWVNLQQGTPETLWQPNAAGKGHR